MSLLSTNSPFRAAAIARPAFSGWQTLRRLPALIRSRRALSKLSAAQLQDVGLSPDQAHQEAQRPIWDVPATWVD